MLIPDVDIRAERKVPQTAISRDCLRQVEQSIKGEHYATNQL